MSFKEILNVEKPREKAIRYGFNKLSNAELLAIFFRTGSQKESVITMSQKFIEEIKGINNLTNIKYKELIKIKGIGESKALTLLASIELVKRIHISQTAKQKIFIKKPVNVYTLMKHLFSELNFEQFFVLLLNRKNELIEMKQLYQGTSNRILIDLKDIFKFCLENIADKIICVHNHPSGNSNPSLDDWKTNKEIETVAKKLNVYLLDHIIIGDKEYYSMTLKKKFKENTTIDSQ